MTTTDRAMSVTYGPIGAQAASFQRQLECKLGVAEATRLLRSAIERHGFWILHEIDPQAVVGRGGYEIPPVRQILFFHPRQMARILAADPAPLLEAPLKFAILELPDRGVEVRWIDPAAAFARYGHPVLADLGRELAEIVEKIALFALASPAIP